MRYYLKESVVEAFQLTLGGTDASDESPKWLGEAFARGRTGGDGGLFWMGGNLYLNLEGGRVEVALYDWIVRDPDGGLVPCKPDVFELMFAPVAA